jgi:hypothetical protein
MERRLREDDEFAGNLRDHNKAPFREGGNRLKTAKPQP